MQQSTTNVALPAHYRENHVPASVREAKPPWLDDLDQRDLLLFVHVPKAAGTSFNAVLWQVYGRCFVNYHQRLSGWSPSQFTRRDAANTLAIGGHMPFGFHRQFGRWYHRILNRRDGVFGGRRVRYVTILRDPVERLISYYRFVTSFPPHRLHQSTKGMKPAEFFKHMGKIGNEECRNLQCGLIAGGEATFPTARQRLEEDFHAVGLVEAMDPFVRHLQETLNWPEGFTIERRNASPRDQVEIIEPTVLDWIREHNDDDIRLYQHVRRQYGLPVA